MNKIRSFQFPQDIDTMVHLVNEGFQYPENPAWSVQSDERENMADQISGIKRIWPIMRFLQFFFPLLRDVICGFIYEEDGQPAGLINYMRQRNAPEWHIGNVTVLPAYRRQGIARKLVVSTLEAIRARSARTARLEVVSGNLPAYKLYEELGFTTYACSTQYDFEQESLVEEIPLPAGFTLKYTGPFDWERRMAFAGQITPEDVMRYEPIEASRYRPPLVMRILHPIFSRIGGSKTIHFSIQNSNGNSAALGNYNYRTRPHGVNRIEINLAPTHPELADFVARFALASIQKVSPGRRIEIDTKDWQPALSQAYERLGAVKRLSYYQMGLLFD